MSARFEPEIIAGAVTCPYCGSTETELFSLFGQQLLTVQFYCQTCHTPFEHVKDDAILNERGVAHIEVDGRGDRAGVDPRPVSHQPGVDPHHPTINLATQHSSEEPVQ